MIAQINISNNFEISIKFLTDNIVISVIAYLRDSFVCGNLLYQLALLFSECVGKTIFDWKKQTA